MGEKNLIFHKDSERKYHRSCNIELNQGLSVLERRGGMWSIIFRCFPMHWGKMMQARFLQMNDAVNYSGRSRASLYVLLSDQKIQARKAGKTLLIDRRSLDDYLDSLPAAVHAKPKVAA